MEADQLTGVTGMLLDKGLLGLAALVLGWVSFKLFQRLQDVQDKRIAESRESVKALTDAATAIEQLSDLIRAGANARAQP